MRPALADRLSRALVGCYPPRWKQRYAAELLDVLDQHRAGPRTVLSLAGGVLSTHLDPDYRIEIRAMPRLGRDTWRSLTIFAVIVAGLAATVVGPAIARSIRESSWQASADGSAGTVAFSRDLRFMVSAVGGPPWAATSTLWDVTDRARPRRLSVFEGGNPITISPDGRTVATSAFSGQPALWNVTRPHHPAHAIRIATMAGPHDYFTALAFSPRGNLLAGVTYHGSVLVFRLAGPARPVRAALLPGIVASARFPSGTATVPASSCAPSCGVAAASAAAFTPDGHALTVVIDRPETYPSTAARDTVFTWQVASSGALSDLTTIFRDVSDVQPTLVPGDRVAADASVIGGQVHLWALP